MKPEFAERLREILATQTVAALGTLHNGHPSVSMAPFAVDRVSATLLIHVSTLATHTKDMLADPNVSLLVIAPPPPGVLPQALPRVTVNGVATQRARTEAGYEEARAAYLARFPEAADLFGFSDFSLFQITLTHARFVGGFAQAASVMAEELAAILRER